MKNLAATSFPRSQKTKRRSIRVALNPSNISRSMRGRDRSLGPCPGQGRQQSRFSRLRGGSRRFGICSRFLPAVSDSGLASVNRCAGRCCGSGGIRDARNSKRYSPSRAKLSHLSRELTTLVYCLQPYEVRKSTEAVHRMVMESPSTASPAMVCYSISWAVHFPN